ncbi:MAG: alpha/beta hydrolase [Eubacteriales bacterium]|nr:alpha/beta hydrolase [Eubacteriales bacterium]
MTKRISAGLRGAAQLALFAGACAGAGAMVGAANYFYEYALVPKKRDSRIDSDSSQKEYVSGRRWMKNHPMREDVYIRADDGLQLHGNFIPAEKGKQNPGAGAGSADTSLPGSSKTRRAAQEAENRRRHQYAVCVHGYGDVSDSMGLYARMYHDRYGMNVLLPDLRGFGRSDGIYVGMGHDESHDLLRWIDWILERDPDARIILHGISMGAATVLMTTGRCLPEQVAAAVSDSSYTSARDILMYVYNNLDKSGDKPAGSGKGAARKRIRRNIVPAPVMVEAVRAAALFRAGYDIAKSSPVDAVEKSHTPTLFIHGQADTFVPPEMMPVLYQAAACPKAFLWIPEADHVQAVNVDPETYWAKVERFLHAQDLAL